MLVGGARDLGLDRHDAVALLGLIGVGTIVGRFLLTAMADAIGRRGVFLICCGGMAAAMPLWAAAEDRPVLQAFAIGFGTLQGGFVALLPAFVADRFGVRSLGERLGLLYTSRGIALLVAAPLAIGIALLVGHPPPVLASALLGAAGTLLMARVGHGLQR
ncbi:MFS transporter [Roseomonas nepalensis]|uniref:MFS transporter n=2 Tax=Muricoccus nepalensis TaxID=1854500 RepID=A0A502G1U0_9PROT|nr:MFS transporter [Roseomonas nepalensis]